MKNVFMAILLTVSTLFFAGCGSESMMDDYIFGSRVYTAGASAIEVALPFDLVEGNPADAIMRGMKPDKVYVNMDSHLIMQVASENQTSSTAEDFTKAQLESYALNANLTGVDGTIQTVTINDIPMQQLVVKYKAQNIPLLVMQYNFVDKGVLWSVTYRTKRTDALGEEVIKYIGGNIKRVQ